MKGLPVPLETADAMTVVPVYRRQNCGTERDNIPLTKNFLSDFRGGTDTGEQSAWKRITGTAISRSPVCCGKGNGFVNGRRIE